MRHIRALQLKQESQIVAVLQHLALGMSVKESCEVVGVGESTWYGWQRMGYVQPILEGIGEDLKAQFVATLKDRWPDVVTLLLNDASDSELNARYRDASRRTLLQALKQLGPKAVQHDSDGEDAKAWLKEHRFPNVIVGVNVNVEQPQSGNYSPVLTSFPLERQDVVDGEAHEK